MKQMYVLLVGLIFLTTLIRCDQTEGKSSVSSKSYSIESDHIENNNSFSGFCFKLDSTWIKKIDSDTIVAFISKNRRSYTSNFTFIRTRLARDNKLSMDELVVASLKQLHDVYSKVNIIKIDSISSNKPIQRKVLFSSVTYQNVEVGTVALFWINRNFLYTFSYQGDNENGAFEKEIPLIEKIESSIKICE
jgi:hypothetical protein